MNPLSQGTSSSPVDPPMKRKRGRPRKDESAVLGEKTPVMPESDNTKKNKQTVAPTDAAGGNMVGRVITGVIDGSFDAGYLVKVKVEDSDIPLRGLVFQPGRFTPITAENDVAPQAKMYRRADIPIPVFHPPTQLPSFVTSPKHSDKQLVELKKLALTVQDKGLQSGFQPTAPIAKESLSVSQMLPRTEYLQGSTGPLFGGNIMPPQVLGSGHENQFVSSPPADILPVSETRKQPSGDDLKLSQPVHDGVKGPCSLMEKQASPKNAGPSEPIASFPSLLFGREAIPPSQKLAAEGFSLQRVIEPQSDVPSGATNIMKAGVDISAATSLPAALFGREAILPESKAAADEPVLPRMTEPQLCNSPDVTNNVDSNIKDVIPPAES